MAQTCVLDASAVIRLICADPSATPWAKILVEAPLVMAPELMLTEVTNTLWRLQRANRLASLDPQRLLADARELADEVVPDRQLHAEALALACHLDHPVYDCLYLALARREAATLITADRRLQQLSQRVLP